MAHSEETRLAVRRSYIVERLDIDAASEKHGVSKHTGRRWMKQDADAGDDWDKHRLAYYKASGGIDNVNVEFLGSFVELMQTTLEAVHKDDVPAHVKADAIAKLSDSYSKVMKSAGGGDPKLGKLSVALEVLQELSKFIQEEHRELVEPFSKMLEQFGKRLSEVFGK